MSLVVAPDPITQLFVIEALRKRLVIMSGILLLGFFAFGERSGASSVSDGVKGVTVGDGGVVDFRH